MPSQDKPFNASLRSYFQADAGAYSPVTDTEVDDGQVTVSGHEKELVVGHFGEANLAKFRGNDATLQAAGLDARHDFRLFPTGSVVKPKLKYPKATGNELRLYFNADEFVVKTGRTWGVFLRNGEIWIYQMPISLHNQIAAGKVSGADRSDTVEEETDDYQALINSNAPEQVVSTSKAWKRDPQVAARAVAAKGYLCELAPEESTFVSRRTGQPFIEAHHLVPMKEQEAFDINLDREDNVCALSPFAHRKIHHGKFEDIEGDIRELAKSRQALLDELELSVEELLTFYRTV